MIYRQEPVALDLRSYFDDARMWCVVFVAFDTSMIQVRPGRWPQPVTTCIIRCEEPFVTAIGVTVCSPNDVRNDDTGRKVAFKRAAHELVRKLMLMNQSECWWWPRFRRALWDARREELARMAEDQAENAPVQVSTHS